MKERNSNDDYENESSKTSANMYKNSKYLLFGGTNKRKRKRMNYAKLNSVGFDVSDSFKSSKQSIHKDTKLRANVHTKSMFNFKEDNNKLNENIKQTPLSTFFSHEGKLLNNGFPPSENHEISYTEIIDTKIIRFYFDLYKCSVNL